MAGRRSKFTQQVKESILESLKMGTPVKYAVAAAGIHQATYFEWLKKGEAQSLGPYHEFLEAIEAAQGQAVVSHLSNIATAAQNGSWQASAWLLERRFYQEFSKTQKTEQDNEKQRLEIEKLKAEIEKLKRESEYDDDDHDAGLISLFESLQVSCERDGEKEQAQLIGDALEKVKRR